MRTIATLLSLLFVISTPSIGQEKLEVEGAITIENSSSETPALGTIRFNSSTNDFEGWNGFFWASLTGGITFETGTVTDVDLNVYKTVKIGGQWWMAENLKTSKYKNGSLLDFIDIDDPGDVLWVAANYGAWCIYEDIDNYEEVYGKLYNWHAVDDSRGLCPQNWHVPSDAEWTTLIDYLDPAVVQPNIIGIQSTVAGEKMKETGLAHWNADNVGATNESGFTGLPGGLRGLNGVFVNIGNTGYWWSDTFAGGNGAWYRNLKYDNGNVDRWNTYKEFGFSVRCVRDLD